MNSDMNLIQMMLSNFLFEYNTLFGKQTSFISKYGEHSAWIESSFKVNHVLLGYLCFSNLPLHTVIRWKAGYDSVKLLTIFHVGKLLRVSVHNVKENKQ